MRSTGRRSGLELIPLGLGVHSLVRVLDYGGQRGERRKWIPALSGQVSAVIFVCALSGYNQRLREDPSQVTLLAAILCVYTLIEPII